MIKTLQIGFDNFYEDTVLAYIESLYQSPFRFLILVIDIVLVVFLAYKLVQILKGTRAWQLVKGIAFLIVTTALSSLFGLKILNNILTYFMSYGVILLIVIFQPELRRALEQLGTSKISRFFGIDRDIAAKTKENIYKIAIAAVELSKRKVRRNYCH